MFGDRKKIGKLIKMKRIESDLTQEALADENISAATISFIEKGREHVGEDKIQYLCSLLDIDVQSDLEAIEQQIYHNEQVALSKLKIIENKIDLVDPQKGLKQLISFERSLKEPISDHITALILYLKGRAYMLKGRPNSQYHFDKAEKNLREVLKYTENNPQLKQLNIDSLTYQELGRVFYFRNQFGKALKSVQKGLSVFTKNGDRTYLEPILKVNISIYLEKLDRLRDSLETLEQMWDDIDTIVNIQVVLNMYETRALVLKKLDRPHEAIKFCNKGIDIARFNEVYERSFDLWTVRGSIFADLGEYDTAEECFLAALDLRKHIKKKYLFISTFTELAELYLKKGLFKEAIEYANEAVNLGKETNDIRRLGQALLVLGDCYFHQDNFSKALPFYKEVREIAKEHDFIMLLKSTLVQLVQCSKKADYENYHQYVDELVEIEVRLK